MFLEQIGSLEKENATLASELKENKETDEFKSLEEEFRKEHEVRDGRTAFCLTRRAKSLTVSCFVLKNELQNEIACLRKALEASEVQRLELQVT